MNIGIIPKLLSDKINLTKQIEKEITHYLTTLINTEWEKYPNGIYRAYVKYNEDTFIVTFDPDSLSFQITGYLKETPGMTKFWKDIGHTEFPKLWKSLTKLAAFK